MTATQTMDNGKAEAANMFRQANDNFKTALETGMRFQQDAFRSMTDVISRGESFEDVRDRVETLATDSINLIRKNAEQAQRLFDETCKTGIETIRKTFDAVDAPAGKNKDYFVAQRDLWNVAFDTMRSNVDMASKFSTQAIENWSNYFSKNPFFGEKKPAAR